MGIEMRKFVYIIAVTIVFSCAIVIVSCDSDSETDDARIIEINGNSLTLPTELSELKDAFGEWDRVCDHGNGIYVWDEIGMWVTTPQEETTTD